MPRTCQAMTDQGNRTIFSVSEQDDLGVGGKELRNPVQQSFLLSKGAARRVLCQHQPGQRKCAVTIGYSYKKHMRSTVYLGCIQDQSDLAAGESGQQEPGYRLVKNNRIDGLVLQQAFHTLHPPGDPPQKKQRRSDAGQPSG